MHTVKTEGVSFTIPSDYSELNRKQLGHYALSVFFPFENRLEKTSYFFMGLLSEKARKAVKKKNDVQYSQLLNLVEWVHEELEPVANPLEFTFKGITYQAPQEFMESSVIMEFIMADSCLFNLKNDPENIFKLTACLYREKKKKGKGKDRRIDFDGDEMEERAKVFEKIPEQYHYSAVHFIAAVKRKLEEDYHDAFGSTAEKMPEGYEPAQTDWSSILLSIAESGVFGTLEQVKYTNMHEIMMFLDKKERERKSNS